MTMTATPHLEAEGFAFLSDDGWAKLPEGFEFPEVAGVAVDESDNLYVFNRGPHPLIVLDKHGSFLRSWGEGFYGGRAHGVTVSPDGFVYCVENTRHAIEKYTQAGELVWTLGNSGNPAPKWSNTPFNLPTHMAVSSRSADIFVSDGYGNNAIHRFSADGRLLASWGGHGIEPGSFQCPHNICLDEDDFVYVADRENNRVQVFDHDGHLEAIWHDIYRPSAMAFHDGLIWCGELLHDPHPLLADCTTMGHRISIFSKNGRLIARLGSEVEGDGPGEFIAPHGITVDSQGNVYVGEVSYTEKGRRLEKVFTSLRRLKNLKQNYQ
jgi:DNA-binding beta-propeller fold protein YncE